MHSDLSSDRSTLSSIGDDYLSRSDSTCATDCNCTYTSNHYHHVAFRRQHLSHGSIGESNFLYDENDSKEYSTKTFHYNNTAFLNEHYYADGPNENTQNTDIKCINNIAQLSGRRKSMMRMQEYFGDNEKCCCIDIEGLLSSQGFALSPALGNYHKSFHTNRPSVFRKVVKLDKKLGLRHVLFVIILSVYAIIGGAIFYTLEHDNEIYTLNENRIILTSFLENLTTKVFKIVNVTPTTQQHQQAMIVLRECYREMLMVEDKYAGSVFHKYENFNEHRTWHFSSAVFFAMTLFTTIGYGTIACQTMAGKVMTIIYSVIGIPLMLMVLGDTGRTLFGMMTKFYNSCYRTCRRAKRTVAMKLWKWDQQTLDDCYVDKELPLCLSITVVVIYLLMCSWIVSFWDYYDGVKQGLSYFDSFYFSFQSLATIGLGDVVPNNIKYNPFVALMFLFGLALLSLVNGTVYRKVERKFISLIDRFETWLQNVNIQRPLPQGYTVFKHLSPNIQLLALALPIFDDMEEANIHEMLDPRNTKVGRWAFADHARSRSTTLPAVQPPHTATLGVFATTSTKPRSTTFANYHSIAYGGGRIPTINGSTSDYMHRIQLRRVLSENDEERLIVPTIPSRSRAATDVCENFFFHLHR